MAKGILITGGGGLLGTRLLERLVDDPKVKDLVVLDIAKPTVDHPKVRFVQHDVSEPYPKPPVKVQAAVHLAFLLNPIRDLKRQSAVNLTGTDHFLNFCDEHGVKTVSAVSSGVSYGAHADNPPLLREDSPLRAEPDFPYAYEKRLMEDRLWRWQDDHPGVNVSVLRPCILMGPEVDNYISRTLGRKVVPTVAGANPPMQFVHVWDVAKALALLVLKNAQGPFNVAAPDTVNFWDVIRMAGNTPMALPEFIKDSVGEMLWQTGVVEGPPGMAPFLKHPWLLDCSRLVEEMDFSFTYSSESALKTWIRSKLNRQPAEI